MAPTGITEQDRDSAMDGEFTTLPGDGEATPFDATDESQDGADDQGFTSPGDSGPPIDLSEFDDEFDAAVPDEKKDFAPIPDGKYQASITNAEIKRAQSGKAMLKTTLQIMGWTYARRLLFRNNMLATAENMKWLKTDLATCGITLPKLSDLPKYLDHLIGTQLEITVKNKDEKNQSVYLNKRITELSVASDGDGELAF